MRWGFLGGIPRREFTRDSIEEKVAATTTGTMAGSCGDYQLHL